MKYVFVLFAFIVLSSIFSFKSDAAEATKHPCQADVNKLCIGIEGEREKIARCLLRFEDQLEPGCRTLMKSEKAVLKVVPLECEEDHQKFCKNSVYIDIAIAKCLQEFGSNLMPKCQARIGLSTKRLTEIQNNCSEDLKIFCFGKKNLGIAEKRCLEIKIGRLSQRCREEIKKGL